MACPPQDETWRFTSVHTSQDKNGNTALSLAKKYHHHDVVDLLEARLSPEQQQLRVRLSLGGTGGSLPLSSANSPLYVQTGWAGLGPAREQQ